MLCVVGGRGGNAASENEVLREIKPYAAHRRAKLRTPKIDVRA